MLTIHLSLAVLFSGVASFPRIMDNYDRGHKSEAAPTNLSKDDALFLTPYIENGQIEKAQKLATVPPLLKNVHSYSGFLTVNKSANSNIFFWLFKSQQGNWEDKPLVVWLQGGPGASSMFGLVAEIGPFFVATGLKVKRRKYPWNRKFNLVVIDNPVGTGFSFTESDAAYPNNEMEVARDLYCALVQLFKLFPNLQKKELFVTGESYAGKYIPAIGYKIYRENKVSDFKIHVGGLMLGNAWTDPINQLSYGAYLYKLGLIDRRTKSRMEEKEEFARALLRAGNWREADHTVDEVYNEFLQASGVDLYDFVNDDVFKGMDDTRTFMEKEETRKAIHVGNLTFNDGYSSAWHLSDDVMQSVRPWVEELLQAEEFPILFYSGQLDVIVAYPLSLAFYDSLEWSHAYDYYKADRCKLVVGNDVAGYYKTAGTFTEVMVRNTGHMVPTTQPKWAYGLLERFITDVDSFKKCRDGTTGL
nr:PREDICTED: venom serine carboxypeptidase-like [Bemisia tabaci]